MARDSFSCRCLGPLVIGGDERQVDVGLARRRQLDLRLLGRFLQALQRHAVLAEVDALVLLELVDQPFDDPIVDVVAAQVRVAVGRLDLDDALADLEHGDVEGAAAEVVDGDRFVLLLVEPVRQRGRGRFVDDPLDVEVGDPAGVFGRLPLRVVEVRRHRDDRVGDLLAEVRLGGLLELAQNHAPRSPAASTCLPRTSTHASPLARLDDLVRHAAGLARHFVELAAHEPLDREDRVLGVGDRLALGDLADQALAVFRERHHRWRGPRAFLVHDHDGLPVFHHGDDRVGRAQGRFR